MVKSAKDRRPESHQVDVDSLKKVRHIGTDKSEWAERRRLIFADTAWHFDSVGALKAASEAGDHSMGVVTPGEILDVRLVDRPPGDGAKFDRKWKQVTDQLDMFRTEYRELGYVPIKIHLCWRCLDATGCSCADAPHDISVIDWGLMELGRREGDWEKSAQRLRDLADLKRNDLRLFMGNIHRWPQIFVVIGLWYPPRREQTVLL
jgi:hypothetical protein